MILDFDFCNLQATLTSQLHHLSIGCWPSSEGMYRSWFSFIICYCTVVYILKGYGYNHIIDVRCKVFIFEPVNIMCDKFLISLYMAKQGC